MRSGVASRSPEQSPQGDVTGPVGTLPMVARPVDDKASDTLVVGPWRRVLDGEFDSPPSPPFHFLPRPPAFGTCRMARSDLLTPCALGQIVATTCSQRHE